MEQHPAVLLGSFPLVLVELTDTGVIGIELICNKVMVMFTTRTGTGTCSASSTWNKGRTIGRDSNCARST